jgi:thiamine biosynthesis lipoprotein
LLGFFDHGGQAGAPPDNLGPAAGQPAASAPDSSEGGSALGQLPPEAGFDGAKLVFSAMRARCEIMVPRLSGSSQDPEALAELAKAAVLRVASLLSPSGEASDIRRVNEAPPGRLVTVDALTMAAIAEAWAWRERSGGVFEPTLGPVKKLYSFDGREVGSLPAKEALAAALALTGPEMFMLDEVHGLVARAREGASLDLGAIGKGLAADLAAAALLEAGAKNALVNLGGEMRVLGRKPSGGSLAPWTVELVDPLGREARYLLEISDQAVATSGDYESFFLHQGRRYSHLLDPKTALPVEGPLASATVIHPRSAAAADAVATIACALGPAKAAAWLEASKELFPEGLTIIMFSREPDGTLSATSLALSPGGQVSRASP